MEGWLPGADGGGSEGLVFNWYRDSVWDNKKVLEMESGDGQTTL